jgi:hypothetical protein
MSAARMLSHKMLLAKVWSKNPEKGLDRSVAVVDASEGVRRIVRDILHLQMDNAMIVL